MCSTSKNNTKVATRYLAEVASFNVGNILTVAHLHMYLQTISLFNLKLKKKIATLER